MLDCLFKNNLIGAFIPLILFEIVFIVIAVVKGRKK